MPPETGTKLDELDKNGCVVKIINKTVSVYDSNGKLLRQEDIIDYTRTNILGSYAAAAELYPEMVGGEKKAAIRDGFKGSRY